MREERGALGRGEEGGEIGKGRKRNRGAPRAGSDTCGEPGGGGLGGERVTRGTTPRTQCSRRRAASTGSRAGGTRAWRWRICGGGGDGRSPSQHGQRRDAPGGGAGRGGGPGLHGHPLPALVAAPDRAIAEGVVKSRSLRPAKPGPGSEILGHDCEADHGGQGVGRK